MPYFPVFSANTGKYGPEKTPHLETFHAVSSSHFTCKVANKCLNVLRGIKCVPSLTLPARESLLSVKGNRDRKKKTENLDFIEYSTFIRGSTEADFRGYSVITS